jgi:hypothetical protein
MRVITPNGFGNVEFLSPDLDDLVMVTTERKNVHPREKQQFKRAEIYEFGLYLVARVINVHQRGIYSNILPFLTEEDARKFYASASAYGETRFLLNLETGFFESNRRLSYLVEGYLHLQTWMDRWADERSACPSEEECEYFSLTKRFDDWILHNGGTTDGIYAPSLLEVENLRILRFAISAQRGIVFAKRFD